MKKNPRHWLELQAEIDFRVYLIKDIYNTLVNAPTDPLSRMIDKETGFVDHQRKQAIEILTELCELWEEYQQATGRDTSENVSGARRMIDRLATTTGTSTAS